MTHKTSIHRLKLTDFRNYANAALTLDGRHVVLTGENGAGDRKSTRLNSSH